MPRLRWAAAAGAAVVLLGGAGTRATWTAQATMPGATLRTGSLASPQTLSCAGLTLSWTPVTGATKYVVLLAGLPVATVSGTSYLLGAGGLVSVEAVAGSWTSAPSTQLTCL